MRLRRAGASFAPGVGFFPNKMKKAKGLTWKDVCPWQAMEPKKPKKGIINWDKELLQSKETFGVSTELNQKVALVGPKADICKFAVDAIVNAANTSLQGGSGVDGAIHASAGPGLNQELRGKRCAVGDVVVSDGHKTPAKKILHTVAPIRKGDDEMVSCYRSCLDAAVQHQLRTVAFCCLGTGVFSFPNARAAWLALRTVRAWLDAPGNAAAVDGIIFVTFQDIDTEAYQHLLPHFFPKAAPAEASQPLPAPNSEAPEPQPADVEGVCDETAKLAL